MMSPRQPTALLVVMLLSLPSVVSADGPESEDARVSTSGPADPELRDAYRELVGAIRSLEKSKIREIHEMETRVQDLASRLVDADVIWRGLLLEVWGDGLAALNRRSSAAVAYNLAGETFLDLDVAEPTLRVAFKIRGLGHREVETIVLEDDELGRALGNLMTEIKSLGEESYADVRSLDVRVRGVAKRLLEKSGTDGTFGPSLLTWWAEALFDVLGQVSPTEELLAAAETAYRQLGNDEDATVLATSRAFVLETAGAAGLNI